MNRGIFFLFPPLYEAAYINRKLLTTLYLIMGVSVFAAMNVLAEDLTNFSSDSPGSKDFINALMATPKTRGIGPATFS